MTAQEMLDKFSKDTNHPYEVRKLAMMIFDGVSEQVEQLSNKQRKYLENAALLHDIGYAIESKNHHKHSQKMVLEHGLDEFNEREKEIISCICRYHRGSLPDKDEHEIYCHFDKKERKTVKRLGGILKIADALDRGHINLIKKLRINYDIDNNIVEILITSTNPQFHPDISDAIKKKDLFEIGFKTQVVFKFEA